MAVDPSRLATLPLFAGLNESQRQQISKAMREVRVASGDACLRAGERPPGLLVLAAGQVRGNLDEAGDELAFTVDPGGCVGEFSLMEGSPGQFTYTAVSDCTLYLLRAEAFHEMVEKRPVVGAKVLKAMIRASISALAGANSTLDGLVKLGERARLRSIYDPLTGLFNRRYLEESMDQFFRKAGAGAAGGRGGAGAGAGARPCALIMMDVDRFRELNARIGTAGADRILARLGSFIGVVVPNGGIPSRLAGDEFAVFLPDADAEAARLVAAAIAERVAETEITEAGEGGGAGQGDGAAAGGSGSGGTAAGPEGRFRLALSQGIAVCPGTAASGSALMTAADAALLEAKRKGRNRIEVA